MIPRNKIYNVLFRYIKSNKIAGIKVRLRRPIFVSLCLSIWRDIILYTPIERLFSHGKLLYPPLQSIHNTFITIVPLFELRHTDVIGVNGHIRVSFQ